MQSSVTSDGRNLVTGRATPPLWLVTGFWISIAISAAVVVRRLVAIVNSSQSAPVQMATIDAAFASPAALTVAHNVPTMAVILLTPFLFLCRTVAAWAA